MNARFEATLVGQLAEIMYGDPGTSLSADEPQPGSFWTFDIHPGKPGTISLVKAGPSGNRDCLLQDDTDTAGYPARLLMKAIVDRPPKKQHSRGASYAFYSLRPDNFATMYGDGPIPTLKASGKVRADAELVIARSNSIIRNAVIHRGLREVKRVTTQINLTKLSTNMLSQID
jgi:hypothetical protein